MTTPVAWGFEKPRAWAIRPSTRRMRASTSAGPAVSRRTSLTPQSALTAVRPPSVRMSTSGTVTPVVCRILQSDLALARSARASTRMTSDGGAVISCAGSAGMARTRWLSRPSAGNGSASTALVRISSCATNGLSPTVPRRPILTMAEHAQPMPGRPVRQDCADERALVVDLGRVGGDAGGRGRARPRPARPRAPAAAPAPRALARRGVRAAAARRRPRRPGAPAHRLRPGLARDRARRGAARTRALAALPGGPGERGRTRRAAGAAPGRRVDFRSCNSRSRSSTSGCSRSPDWRSRSSPWSCSTTCSGGSAEGLNPPLVRRVPVAPRGARMIDLPTGLPAELVPLSWLIGVWEGTGLVEYEIGDRIERHEFGQRVSFSQDGLPFLNYNSYTWLFGETPDGDDGTTTPLVTETGYW